MNQAASGGLKPNLTLLFDVPVEVGLRRAAGRGRGKDRMEREKIRFHQKVRQVFLQLARKEKRRFIVLDGRKSQKEVYQDMIEEMNERLPDSSKGLSLGRPKARSRG